MYQDAQVRSVSREENLLYFLILALEKQLEIDPKSKKLLVNLSQYFEILEFQLGDVLGNIAPATANLVQREKIPHSSEEDSKQAQFFYIICQGRVRLLSFNSEKQREVPTGLLTEGDTFGGERIFDEEYLPYKAVAAETTIQVVRIPLARLQPELAKSAQLEKHWLIATQNRQSLIFLKTLTALGSLSSYRLQQILAYLEKRQIPAGTNLAEANLDRFWLRQGQIGDRSLDIGSSWGYPDPIPDDWVAKTDLRVYHLPRQHWETVCAIAPVLANIYGKSQASESRNHRPTETIVFAPRKNQLDSIVTVENKTEITSPTEDQQNSASIDFPQPRKKPSQFWRRYPFIQQQSSSDCGAACLGMISQYWGKRFTINYLRNLAGIGRIGVSLKGLTKAAENLGYQARPVRASLNRLVEQSNPWIAHWAGDHYIVVYWIRGDRILVADPAKGKHILSRQEFIASWTGYGLLLNPTERLYQTPNEKRSLGKFFGLLLPYRNLVLQIITLSVLIQVFGIVSPLFTQIILDQIVVNKSQTTLNVFVIGALLFGVWGMGLSATRNYLLSYFSNRLNLTMVSGFINHTLTLPLKFFESRRVGDITTRVGENSKIQRFLLGQVLLSWLNFVTGFVYLGLMLYYNWQLTLLVLGLIPPIVILTLVATPLLRKLSRERFNAAADQNSSLVEMMTGVATVKSVAAEREVRWRWEDLLTHQINVRFKGQKLAINLGLLSGLINSIGGTALLWYGATLVIQDQLSIGQFVAFNMMKGHIISPVIALVGLWDELQEVLISVERLNDVFDTEQEETPEKQMLTLPTLQGDVRFENVTFRYDTEEGRNALQNISFEVKAGQTLAIVGRSGSGKSTLVKLLQGLYFPTSGRIWIDGHDIQHVSPPSLRSQLGVVPQDCFLFSGTILENIILYRPEFTLEQAIEAAKLAEAHGFIQAMPLGYNTKVGERGSTLSGGQRQRIAIARALLGEPKILILDEATSSLDTESETRFQHNLARISRECTTFIIAHRLSTVRNADCILVLDRGFIVEQGTHEELIAQRNLYYHLAKQQLDI
ncbi:MAG: ABC transporter transmembrane domain-containing protein [Xenococcaceae cyanobacterium MO_207.B15]|nr:ABC transporter transmembrane domain-containing protein [Xenococcaceae cyanobacterium MO_207.B15]